jgi:hypothetical protein
LGKADDCPNSNLLSNNNHTDYIFPTILLLIAAYKKNITISS